jgi:hypothetical protein
MGRNQRHQLTGRVRAGRCVICGNPDGPECASCTASHDKAVERAGDV